MSPQARIGRGTSTAAVLFGGVIRTVSETAALQFVGPCTRALADAPEGRASGAVPAAPVEAEPSGRPPARSTIVAVPVR